VTLRLYSLSTRRQWPERVPKEIVGIIGLLQCTQSFPIATVTIHDTLGGFTTSQELLTAVSAGQQKTKRGLTLGNGPPIDTGSSVLYIHFKNVSVDIFSK